jgi:aspartate kinase
MTFGDTSIAAAERNKRAARRIVAQREASNRVVGMLSARGQTTDGPFAARARGFAPCADE